MYSLGIRVLSLLTHVWAVFNPKARQFVNGRKGIFSQLENAFKHEKNAVAWIHCASLGEFEQGRPIIESFKKEFPSYKILLTFFSPSGYEVRKNYEQADYIYYLPWDTSSNAERFIEIVNPRIALFVKYEFWHHYIKELHDRRIPVLSVSAIFRPGQIFFSSYGSFFRQTLKRINRFFVQNEDSKQLLESINIHHVTVAGDTRFDRVKQIVDQKKEIEAARQFKGNDNIMVIGSCWPEDFELLAHHINEGVGKLKFIIAPHEIKESFLTAIEESLNAKVIRFSQASGRTDYDVLLIDNVGMLSSLYQYGEYAYVGGGFGKGLHNILEAACYGIPVFFGNRNFQKFKEAKDLIMRGGAFEIADYADFKKKFEALINRPENYLLACQVTKAYVMENLGANRKIMEYTHTLIDNS